jgi:hypothetical protein
MPSTHALYLSMHTCCDRFLFLRFKNLVSEHCSDFLSFLGNMLTKCSCELGLGEASESERVDYCFDHI